jgi:hypothetical protein
MLISLMMVSSQQHRNLLKVILVAAVQKPSQTTPSCGGLWSFLASSYDPDCVW